MSSSDQAALANQFDPPAVVQPTTPVVPVRRRSAARTLSLVLATVWLAVSVAVGVWLFTGVKTSAIQLNATKPNLSAQSANSAYGGDAYTGIQNAASDTEHAVVDSANGLSQFSQELAESSATLDRALSNRLQQGLGILIIGVGVLTFIVALSRTSDS